MIFLELKQLEAYVKVYELKSFSKTANEMYLSQPSISGYINALESELKTKLIYRSTKEFLPTKSGKLFYEYAKDMLLLRDKSIYSMQNMSDQTTGSIDISASSVPAQYILPEIIGAFHKLYPNIIFNMKQTDTSEVIKEISAHQSEIGFVGTKLENNKCRYEEFMTEKLILLAPNEKRFRDISPQAVADLLRHEFYVMRERGSGTRYEYEEYLKNIGIRMNELNISAYFNNTQSILHAVAHGLGLSIVSELAARHYIKQNMVIAMPITFLPRRSFYMVMKKNNIISATADIFIQFVLSYIQNEAADI